MAKDIFAAEHAQPAPSGRFAPSRHHLLTTGRATRAFWSNALDFERKIEHC
jgi:hypothetical protein